MYQTIELGKATHEICQQYKKIASKRDNVLSVIIKPVNSVESRVIVYQVK